MKIAKIKLYSNNQNSKTNKNFFNIYIDGKLNEADNFHI